MNTAVGLLIGVFLITAGLLVNVVVLVNAVNMMCNAVTKLKHATIKNTSKFPTGTCHYTIKPYSTKVCQLLIEFHSFELQAPIWDSNTETLECGDNLVIGDFTFCGSNSGQHLYLPFSAGGINEIVLALHLPNRWNESVWNLDITQLECPVSPKRSQLLSSLLGNNYMETWRSILSVPAPNNDWNLLAPPGCNQYFTKPTGNIKSFNFKDDGSTFYLPNMNYMICIKSSPVTTIIEYKALKFSMSPPISHGGGFDEDCHSVIHTTGRSEDYLMIPHSKVVNNLSMQPTYYCGTSLQTQAALIASPPFIMYFSSDGRTEKTETGFNINYNVWTVS